MKRYPYLQQGERELLKQTSNYIEPQDVEAEYENDTRDAVSGEFQDPYEKLQSEVLDGVTHSGKGYIGVPGHGIGGGYIRAPNTRGGFLPLAAMLLPLLLGSGTGSGTGRRGGNMLSKMIFTNRPLNMSSPKNFFKSLFEDIAERVNPKKVAEKFDKLFAGKGTFNRYLKQKDGGVILDDMKMGHLLMPLLNAHLKVALKKASGINPEGLLEKIEDDNRSLFEKPVTHETLQSGGSILGSLWTGLKSIFSKISNNPTAMNLGTRALTALGKTNLPEKGVQALSEYATKKLTGEEPEEKKIRQQETKIAEMKRARELRALERAEEREQRKEEREEEEEEDEYYDRRHPRRKVYEEPIRGKVYDYEVPSGQSDSQLRRRLAEERRRRDLIPTNETNTSIEPVKEKTLIGFKNGKPVYASGLKKKKGGSWKVVLQRS